MKTTTTNLVSDDRHRQRRPNVARALKHGHRAAARDLAQAAKDAELLKGETHVLFAHLLVRLGARLELGRGLGAKGQEASGKEKGRGMDEVTWE